MSRGKKGTRGQEQSEMIGQKFGRLLVLSYDEEASKRRDHYLCKCDCDKELIVSGEHLRKENTRSCGCLHRERVSKNITNNSLYYHGFYAGRQKFRKTVHARDKVCQHEGEHKGRLEAHHLDGDGDNHDPKNGSLLCRKHHMIITRGNNVWRPHGRL